MTHQFSDRDIDEIFTGYRGWSNDPTLFINYIGPTQSTFYTREDLLRMIDIIDGVEEGVVVVKSQPPEKPKEPKIRIFKS